MVRRALKVVEKVEPLKLDLGCGKHKKEGFTGVDRVQFEGVDIVCDLMKKWPWEADSVEEIHMSHCLEHFTGRQRVHIFNEMYRVLEKGGKATIITPHWCSNRAYGDYTHEWPPVSEMLYYYTDKVWRSANSPHNDIENDPEGYRCDFEFTAVPFTVHPVMNSKTHEAVVYALTFYKEACQDLIATLIKR